MLQLPDEFLASSGGKGGGVLQGTSSEAIFILLLGAKAKMVKKTKEIHADWDDSNIVPKLIGYCSRKKFRLSILLALKNDFFRNF